MHKTENGTRGWERKDHGIKTSKKQSNLPDLKMQHSRHKMHLFHFYQKVTRNCKGNLLPQFQAAEKELEKFTSVQWPF